MSDTVLEQSEIVEINDAISEETAVGSGNSEASGDMPEAAVAEPAVDAIDTEAAEIPAENIEAADGDVIANTEAAEMEDAEVQALPEEKSKKKEKASAGVGKSVLEFFGVCALWIAAVVVGMSKQAAVSVKKVFLGFGKAVAKTAKASVKTLSRYSILLTSGVGSVLYFIGHSAWRVFSEIFIFILTVAASFLTVLFGAIFGWLGRKFKQPLLEIWCFIITPVAHAWGWLAHAHIRLKKARKRGFFHALGSMIASFWRFLGGLREVGRFAFNYIAPIVSIAFLFSLIRYASTLQYAISVSYNGSDIGTIENEATFKEAETLIQDKVTFIENEQPIIGTPTFSVTVLNMSEDEKQPVDDIDLLSETLIETGDVSIVYAYGFYINDELIGVYSEEDLGLITDALNQKLGLYSRPNAVDVRFEDDIVISEGRFIEDVLTAPDGALELINGATEVEAYYVVVRGDTITKICQNLGITRDEFELYNPELAGGISRGDIVTYHYLEPHLNVLTSYYENYDQVIERVTEYVESSRYEQYCEILLQHGSDGFENVTALITQTNGVETDRVITSRTILEEMVPRRFRVGTKENTYLDGNTKIIDTLGTFCWPLGSEKGYISTMPGWRAWDNSNHIALDIAGIPRGTDIYAACDGKVTFAGTKGAYGKLVIVDVGHGYECYYAHCSEIDVKEGDRVEKGDVIAHVGMTGSASGNHLHFEMHYNGSRINPLPALGGTGGHEIRQY